MLISERRLDGTTPAHVNTFKSALETLEQVHYLEVHALSQEIKRLDNLISVRERGVTSIEPPAPQIPLMQPQTQSILHDCIDIDGFGCRAGTSVEQVNLVSIGMGRSPARSSNVREHSTIDHEEQRDSSPIGNRRCEVDLPCRPFRAHLTPPSDSLLKASSFVLSNFDHCNTSHTSSRSRKRSLTDEEDYAKKSVAMSVMRRKMTALDALGRCASNDTPIEERSRSDLQSCRYGISSLVNSPLFEVFCAFAILTNSIFLGIRVQQKMDSPNEDSRTLQIFEYGYMVLFALELCARIGVRGLGVFCDRQQVHWYFLDLFVVLTSFLEFGLEVQSSGSDSMNLSNARMFRVLRIVRLVNVLRVVRLVSFFRALRKLVLSIAFTLKSVMWAFCLLFITIYMFSLVVAQLVSNYMNSGATIPFSVRLYWGTLPRIMFTLFKCITNGISWHDPVIALAEVDDALVALFVFYISFTVFAFLNVITGVFCEAAIDAARQDGDMMIHQHLVEKKKFTHALQELFGFDGSGRAAFVLSYLEFEGVLDNPITKAHLAAMQLDTQDAWELFKLLDTDESALIDVEEFVSGCLRLKGMAKSLDLAKLSYESKSRHRRLVEQMSAIDDKLSELQSCLKPSLHTFSHSSPIYVSAS